STDWFESLRRCLHWNERARQKGFTDEIPQAYQPNPSNTNSASHSPYLPAQQSSGPPSSSLPSPMLSANQSNSIATPIQPHGPPMGVPGLGPGWKVPVGSSPRSGVGVGRLPLPPAGTGAAHSQQQDQGQHQRRNEECEECGGAAKVNVEERVSVMSGDHDDINSSLESMSLPPAAAHGNNNPEICATVAEVDKALKRVGLRGVSDHIHAHVRSHCVSQSRVQFDDDGEDNNHHHHASSNMTETVVTTSSGGFVTGGNSGSWDVGIDENDGDGGGMGSRTSSAVGMLGSRENSINMSMGDGILVQNLGVGGLMMRRHLASSMIGMRSVDGFEGISGDVGGGGTGGGGEEDGGYDLDSGSGSADGSRRGSITGDDVNFKSGNSRRSGN
ncbi:hypothetical protein HDU76_011509, partial [Blyttiomyces sp. JEL0837]